MRTVSSMALLMALRASDTVGNVQAKKRSAESPAGRAKRTRTEEPKELMKVQPRVNNLGSALDFVKENL